MIHQEATFAPLCTTQTVTTDETEFANALYEVANKAGLDIWVEVLEGPDRLTHCLTFLCGDDDLICSLYQAAYTLADKWFQREMPGVEEAMQEAA